MMTRNYNSPFRLPVSEEWNCGHVEDQGVPAGKDLG